MKDEHTRRLPDDLMEQLLEDGRAAIMQELRDMQQRDTGLSSERFRSF
jgi:hypothetical protein